MTFSQWMLATLMFFAGSLSGCFNIRYWFGNGPATNGVPNFSEVEPTKVFRGGQPNSRGWEYLRTLGVKTVVKLDYSDEGVDDEARKLGMTVIDAEMQSKGFIHWSGSPKANIVNLAKAEAALSYESRWPIYVHCLYGEDRTGLVVGEFRVLHDHWRTSDAYAEMRALGFHLEIHDLHEVWEQFVREHSVRPFTMENRSGATD